MACRLHEIARVSMYHGADVDPRWINQALSLNRKRATMGRDGERLFIFARRVCLLRAI